MVTAEELVVQIQSQGVSETREDLEGVEGAMEDTAESAGDSAEQLEGFSEQFAGAMTAAVSALAIGAAGLLSQVPVVGESISGLGAIIDAFAFRLDGVLRPALTGINQALFQFANFVFEAEGAAGVFFDALSALTAAVGVGSALALGIAKVGALLGTFASTAAGLSSIAATLAGAIGTVVGVIAGLPVALTAAVVAIAAFAAAYALNLGGVRDTTNRIVGNIIDTVVGGVRAFATAAISRLSSFASRVRGVLTGVSQAVVDWASDLASDAFNWGRDLIQGFINGIQSLLGRVRSFLGDLRDIGASVGVDVPSLGGLGGGGGGGGGTGRSGSAPTRNAFGGGSGATLDGRKLTESTGRYRSDPGRRRGL